MGNIGNAVTYGGTVAVIGLLIVFVGLIILILCISLLERVIARSAAGRSRRRRVETVAAEIAAAPVAEAVAPEPVSEPAADDAQLIAVIAAALAAYDSSGKRLVVRKVRRVGRVEERVPGGTGRSLLRRGATGMTYHAVANRIQADSPE